jgi:hypothetical protein
MAAKPMSPLSGAGTQKSRGACPQKSVPEQVRADFRGHPVPLFRRCACQNPGDMGFDSIFLFVLVRTGKIRLSSVEYDLVEICFCQNTGKGRLFYLWKRLQVSM